jgi:hypothetical protein
MTDEAMPASAFQDALRGAFDFLFTEDGFAFTAGLNERLGEYQMQIAASPVCQIKFVLEQDSFAVQFGHLAAPATWAAQIDGVVWWHDFFRLLEFEDQLHPERLFRGPPWVGEVTLAAQMQTKAVLLRHYRPRLFAALAPDAAHDWWSGFVAFRAQANHDATIRLA